MVEVIPQTAWDVSPLIAGYETGADGRERAIIDPHVMYPATIERIVFCLQNKVIPEELIQRRIIEDEDGFPDHQISDDRMKRLLASARRLPAHAWDAALRHRDEFDSPIPYPIGTGPQSRPDLSVYAPGIRDRIQLLWDRGDALEIALGWFHQAFRNQFGGMSKRILSGFTEEERAVHHALTQARVGTPDPAPRFMQHYHV